MSRPVTHFEFSLGKLDSLFISIKNYQIKLQSTTTLSFRYRKDSLKFCLFFFHWSNWKIKKHLTFPRIQTIWSIELNQFGLVTKVTKSTNSDKFNTLMSSIEFAFEFGDCKMICAHCTLYIVQCTIRFKAISLCCQIDFAHNLRRYFFFKS